MLVLNTGHFHFQIWFYTNDIFRNAGIPEPYIQYTTVGTGAVEVISGMLGVSFTFKVTMMMSVDSLPGISVVMKILCGQRSKDLVVSILVHYPVTFSCLIDHEWNKPIMGVKRHQVNAVLVSFTVLYNRASGQKAPHDWWLLLYGTLLFWDYNNCPVPGIVSLDTPLLLAHLFLKDEMVSESELKKK